MSSLNFYGSPSPLLPGPRIDQQRFVELDRRIAAGDEKPEERRPTQDAVADLRETVQALQDQVYALRGTTHRLQEQIYGLRQTVQGQQIQLQGFLVGRPVPVAALLNKTSPEISKMIAAVAWRFDSSVNLIRSRYRGRPHVTARHVCMLVLQRRGMSLTTVGRIFGRHHTSVLYAVRAAERLLESNEELQAWVRGLMEVNA